MIKIFKYLDNLNCFIVDPYYKTIADSLGLTEWHEVVWIGRYFLMDNDVGEHWFDNWDLRESLESEASKMGLDISDLFIIDPERFKNDYDGPCHEPGERALFWKDVLNSLMLSYETLFREARKINTEREEFDREDYLPDLEDKISQIKHQRA